jgi:hypothetical protein
MGRRHVANAEARRLIIESIEKILLLAGRFSLLLAPVCLVIIWTVGFLTHSCQRSTERAERFGSNYVESCS